MSRCCCSERGDIRVSGEVWENDDGLNTIGGGEKAVRVRCVECGGKIGRVGSDLLVELFGYDESEIVNGACLDDDERRSLEVDLV
jgi:hypothetical protein